MSAEIRALREDELEEHAALVYASYTYQRELAPGSMLTHPDWWLRGIEHDPYYEPAQTRVMVMDGRLVSAVTCYLRPSYIAGRQIRAACIGSVCTHPQYRGRGLMRQVLAEAVDWMVSAGVLWSFLFGLEAVYGGSGWRMLSTLTAVADLEVREEYGREVTTRPADPEADAPLLASLYERFNAGLTGPTVRSEQYWRRRVLAPRPWSAAPGYEVIQLQGQPVGYWLPGDGAVVELAWVDAPGEVLAHLLRRWPGQPVRFGLGTTELVRHLRAISHPSGYDAWRQHRGGINLQESYCGLWRFHQDPQRLFPQVRDTASLLRFLREQEYTMWPADRA